MIYVSTSLQTMKFLLQSLLFVACCCSVQMDDWKPTSLKQCRTNADCGNLAHVCCSITPAFGKRQLGFPVEVNYCLRYKTESAPWCSLRLQHSAEKLNYHGLCPCRPGLVCMPSAGLDPTVYPPSRYGKCVAV
ncbi:uncharacterized protein LOC121385620 [Gigantopelta aegis]|uniref:uncharacterized protein LOC121385620 n=1 Tax=Gigantopelta aegis TaxID=1735272 RepID=UPI001B888D79|nr:uncharacterized protein LOC121385620 [Gigantopelta aegis]